MKLGINEIKEAIYEKAIDKTIRQLQREGFAIKRDYAIKSNTRTMEVDLFAYNDYEKRIYEFKIGKNRIRREQFVMLQNYAREIGARLYVIYLEVPTSNKIAFRQIENIIYADFKNHTPDELQGIATYVTILDVGRIEIADVDIDNEIVEARGNGAVSVEAQFGSTRDLLRNDGYVETVEFEFTFRVRVNVAERNIIDSYYKIDTGWYNQ